MGRLREAHLVLLGMLAVMALPHALHLSAVKVQELENRRMSEPPAFRWSKPLDSSYFDKWSRYVEEWNPLRSYSVIALSKFRFQIFGAVARAPNAQAVVAGKAGWLFIEESLTQQCWPRVPLLEGVSALREIENSIVRAGKRFLFTISPNKATIYPELLSDYLLKVSTCASASLDTLQQLLADAGPKSYLDSFATLKAARLGSARPLYSPMDTHWTEYGSSVFVAELVQRLGIPKADIGILKKVGQKSGLPDLSRLSGLFYEEKSDTYRFERGRSETRIEVEEVTHGGKGRAYVVRRSSNPDLPLDKRKVLILHDSFFYVSWDQLADFFAYAHYVHWTAFEPEELGELARQFDVVIIQSVEREVYNRLSQFDKADATAFARALAGLNTAASGARRK